MRRNLSDEELSFVQQFQEEHRTTPSVAQEEVRQATSRRRKSVLFNVLLTTLAVAPFLLSGFFIYTLGYFQSTLGEGSLDYLRENLTSEQLGSLGREAGVDGLETIVDLYEHRAVVVAGIFSVFIVLIVALLLARVLLQAARERREGSHG